MLRPTLLRLDDDDHVLVLIFNHLIMDGWSMGVFNRELSALYDAFSTGGLVKLPDLPIQPVDFAVWECRFFRRDRSAAGGILEETPARSHFAVPLAGRRARTGAR